MPAPWNAADKRVVLSVAFDTNLIGVLTFAVSAVVDTDGITEIVKVWPSTGNCGRVMFNVEILLPLLSTIRVLVPVLAVMFTVALVSYTTYVPASITAPLVWKLPTTSTV